VPICQQLGIDLVHFGLVMVLNLMIGLLHPPEGGLVLFVLARVAKLSVERTTIAILPWLVPLLARSWSSPTSPKSFLAAQVLLLAMTPFIRLHPHDDVLIARAQLVGGATAENVVVKGLIPPGHKVATRDIARASRCAATTRSSASPASRSPPASTCTRTTSTWADKGDFARDYAFGADVKPSRRGARPPSWASSAPTAAWRRATTSASCPA
jgi:hypothetical protein